MDSKQMAQQLAQDSTNMQEYQQNKENLERRKEAGRKIVEKFIKQGMSRDRAEAKARSMNYIV